MREQDEFSDWAQLRYRSLLHAAYLLTGDRERAQDLVQIALAKTHLAWRRVHSSPDAYVRRVMFTSHADWYRRRPWLELPTDSVPDDVNGADEYDRLHDRDALLQALTCLTPRQRAVVVLRYYHQLSEAETADALGCSSGTVKSTASRALDKLRRHPSLATATEACS